MAKIVENTEERIHRDRPTERSQKEKGDDAERIRRFCMAERQIGYTKRLYSQFR